MEGHGGGAVEQLTYDSCILLCAFFGFEDIDGEVRHAEFQCRHSRNVTALHTSILARAIRSRRSHGKVRILPMTMP